MFRKWEVVIRAINPKTGELATFLGEPIEAPSPKLAQEWCNKNGLGYMKVTGNEVISVISTKKDGITPDWKTRIDYDFLNN